ncbi:MAG TPA: phosphatidate cytidylyltransferase [Candidatus Eisenbacteria bacterium]|nr:phosphatidate cytidylyltransferase [Candidatus Eisenbacteria bacterium]
MITRIKTAIIYGLIIAIFVVPGFWSVHITALLLVAIAILASFEMKDALEKVKFKTNLFQLMLFYLAFLPGYIWLLLSKQNIISASTIFSTTSYANEINLMMLIRLLILYGITMLLLTGITVFRPLLNKGAQGLRQGIINFVAGLYVSLPLFFGFLLLYVIPGGWFWFVLALVTPWISDSAAYFSGVLWGKKAIVPALSPNKTYVGFFGSIIGTIIFYIPLYIFLLPKIYPLAVTSKGILLVIMIAAVLGALIELGDWLASGIKRYCAIKDFSDLLPGHGGIIDRFDSTFFTFTSILFIALVIYIF